MSAFLPSLKDEKGVFVDLINVDKNKLSNLIDVYKKVKYTGTPNESQKSQKSQKSQESQEYYDANGNIETPSNGNEVFMKLGKRNSNSEAADVITGTISVQPDTYYMHVDQTDMLVGGRKPKRLSQLSKKRAMKSRRVRKSRRRYSRRK